MNLDLLRSFLAVSRRLNFTRAAEELARTQPAVSRQIQQLEHELGVTLFERFGRSVHPTDAGRALAPLAERLVGEFDRVVESVRAYGGAGRGWLRIGASTTPGYYLLPPILGRFHRDCPQVELHYVVDNTLAIEQRIVRNELDMAIVGGHLVDAALHIEQVLDDEIICFCGSGHRLAKRREIDLTALRNELWIVREPGSATRQLFEQRHAALGGNMTRVIELASPDGIKALVEAGIGISFMSAYGLRRELRERRLVHLRIKSLRLMRPIYAVHHADKHVSPAMQTFLSQVKDHMSAKTIGRAPR